jgi:hypothetical protein
LRRERNERQHVQNGIAWKQAPHRGLAEGMLELTLRVPF